MMKIANEVLAVLSAAKASGNAVTLLGQLDRKLYEKTNKVLEAAGGKWNRKAKAHVFDVDAEDRLDQIILTGEVTITKDEFEFFETPGPVVARLMELASVKRDMLILEPNGGRGAIALPCAEAGAIVDCYELMEANFAYLSEQELLRSVLRADFLMVEPEPTYDAIVMNPPFRAQADVRHVMHALKFLKPGGVLASVMSAGVLFRQNKLTSDFRELISERGGVIEDLPEASFKKSGTLVSTVAVMIPN